jgi:hypothetical protein
VGDDDDGDDGDGGDDGNGHSVAAALRYSAMGRSGHGLPSRAGAGGGRRTGF